MGVEFEAERRLLALHEMEPVQRSHFPELEHLKRAELVDLTKWLRTQHERAGDIIRDRRRVRRGKVDPRGASAEPPDEHGQAVKKQVFARALKRVNARLVMMTAADLKAQAMTALRESLQRRQAAAPHHPQSGPTDAAPMRLKTSRNARPIVQGAKIGSVTKAGRVSQAGRDARR